MIQRIERIAKGLWEGGCVLDKTRSPEGRGFRLKLHDKQPDAPLSPIYVDLRRLQSLLELRSYVVAEYERLLAGGREYDLIAGIPVAITPIAALVSEAVGKPLITPRTDDKGHGTGAKVDGVYTAGQRVAVLDDLITKADSKLAAIRILEAAGLEVVSVNVLLDREQGGVAELESLGYRVYATTRMSELLTYYRDFRFMTSDAYHEIVRYLAAQ